jgi:ATP-dependent protease ClpP protease subunit
MTKLFNLFRANARRGSFKAEADGAGNTLYLYDVIVQSDADAEWFGGVSPQAFAKALAQMSGPVNLRINSPGGDVFAARTMAQAMREYKGEITAHVDGYAASAASLIAVSAARTIMAPGSFMMIHKAWTWGIGNADDLLAMASLLEKIDGTLADTYEAKGNKSAEEFAALMAAETWFTAEEAIEVGLADQVAAEDAKTARASWDVTAYANAPKVEAANDDAPAPDPAQVEADRIAAQAAADAASQSEIERRQRMLAVRLLHTAA